MSFWSKEPLFWLFHAIALACYLLVVAVLMLPSPDWLLYTVLSSGSKMVFLLLGCFIFRFLYQKYAWQHLQLFHLAKYIALTSVIVSVMACSLSLAISYFSAKWVLAESLYQSVILHGETKHKVLELAWNIFSCIFMVLGWCALYCFVEHRKLHFATKLENLQLQQALKQAQLDALHTQLNPHFLFNSLNNIRSLIRINSEQAIEMITALSQILRFSLTHQQADKIPLESELAIVDCLIDIAQLQFAERLVFSKQLDAGLMQAQVPPLAIQILVENALKHGVDQRKSATELKLTIKRNNQQLNIEVSNCGSLTPVNKQTHGEDKTAVGLKNLTQRLQLVYANQASFLLTEADGKVVAKLNMPLQIGRENAHLAC
ncbi:putative signal transduction histidine kinase [Catenovulum agarivorans DS-2]|uniref:Putative signal transduction histidine kinase n=1 Tax=Catenovulum agarivorans DS-2 TaxID=1328313 RepID=W7QUF3_9ALTE|nr:histidine kinase [Catenovulum agarivorans]EWH11488.1 putative signal transduction histidine kinase [Catenovulum agarivorans DS-2]